MKRHLQRLIKGIVACFSKFDTAYIRLLQTANTLRTSFCLLCLVISEFSMILSLFYCLHQTPSFLIQSLLIVHYFSYIASIILSLLIIALKFIMT